MYQVKCLNKISPLGTSRLGDNCHVGEDVENPDAIVGSFRCNAPIRNLIKICLQLHVQVQVPIIFLLTDAYRKVL